MLYYIINIVYHIMLFYVLQVAIYDNIYSHIIILYKILYLV